MSATTANFLHTFSSRRTIYKLKPELPAGVSIYDVQATVQTIIKESPTALNSQCNRAIILTGDIHKKVWDHVTKSMPNDDARKRPQSVRDEAFGSVIFFTDDTVTEKLQAEMPQIADVFPVCASHATGGAQIVTWAALESLGLGVHIQHYNNQIKEVLPSAVPAKWTVVAQLCFGTGIEAPPAKEYDHNPVEIFN